MSDFSVIKKQDHLELNIEIYIVYPPTLVTEKLRQLPVHSLINHTNLLIHQPVTAPTLHPGQLLRQPHCIQTTKAASKVSHKKVDDSDTELLRYNCPD